MTKLPQPAPEQPEYFDLNDHSGIHGTRCWQYRDRLRELVAAVNELEAAGDDDVAWGKVQAVLVAIQRERLIQ